MDHHIHLIEESPLNAICSASIGDIAINSQIYHILITKATLIIIKGIRSAAQKATFIAASIISIIVSVLDDPVSKDVKCKIDLYRLINTPANHSVFLIISCISIALLNGFIDNPVALVV
jgi:hypothetical protein